MKKLVFLFSIVTILFCFTSCKNETSSTTTTVSEPASTAFRLDAEETDDLLVLMYINITDTDFGKYKYFFEHNKAPNKKFEINPPYKNKIMLEPSFLLLNLGVRGNLPDAEKVNYDFKIYRELADGSGKPEFLKDYKNSDYTYAELKKLNSKFVIQSIKVNFSTDSSLPGHISPPIKPIDQP